MIVGRQANVEWQRVLDLVLRGGVPIETRGQRVIESLSMQSRIDMTMPIVSIKERLTQGFVRFLPAEAYWILSGDSRVCRIAPYAPSLPQFSDNGHTFQGAYGPRVVDQLSYVIDSFKKDLFTRQAVIEIWRPNPRDSKDIPCTLSLQFLYRTGLLNCIATMRSSDTWVGYPIDIFCFSMISAWICLHLKSAGAGAPDVGTLYLNAGSQHIYQRNLKLATDAAHSKDIGDYSPISIYDFNHPDDLLNHLRCVRDANWSKLKSNFLTETKEWRKRE
jgi:hypothetical protein